MTNETPENKRHLISALVENEAGCLSRVVGLFSQRNYNIHSLNVAPTPDPSLSRISITSYGSEHHLNMICKQLNKLISVYKVMEISQNPHLERELLLLKIKVGGEKEKNYYWRLCQIYQAQIIDFVNQSYIVELTSTSERIDHFLANIDLQYISEISRSGAQGIQLEKSYG